MRTLVLFTLKSKLLRHMCRMHLLSGCSQHRAKAAERHLLVAYPAIDICPPTNS